MTPFQDPEETCADDALQNPLDDFSQPPRREGLPPGFRMRADEHYVDALDARPLFVRSARDTSPSQPRAERALPAEAHTTVLEAVIDEALRGITAAATLNAAPTPAVRHGAAEIISVESHRALRLLTAVRVLRGDVPIHRPRTGVRAALKAVVQSIEQEHRLSRMTLTIAPSLDADAAIDANEELFATAIYAIVTAFGVATPNSASRHVQTLTAVDEERQVVKIHVREERLVLPEAWLRLDQPWPVPAGPVGLALMQAARTIAEAHGGSLSMHADRHGSEAQLTLPMASRG